MNEEQAQVFKKFIHTFYFNLFWKALILFNGCNLGIVLWLMAFILFICITQYDTLIWCAAPIYPYINCNPKISTEYTEEKL